MRCGSCGHDVDLSEMRKAKGGCFRACLVCRTRARIRDLKRTLQRATIARQLRENRRAGYERNQATIEARRFAAAGDSVSM